jgi:hypothetical protein
MNKWITHKKTDKELFAKLKKDHEMRGWTIIITPGAYSRGFNVYYRAKTWKKEKRLIRWFAKNPENYAKD